MIVWRPRDLRIDVGCLVVLLFVCPDRAPQIRDLNPSVGHDEDVLGLDVTVHHARRVDRLGQGKRGKRRLLGPGRGRQCTFKPVRNCCIVFRI